MQRKNNKKEGSYLHEAVVLIFSLLFIIPSFGMIQPTVQGEEELTTSSEEYGLEFDGEDDYISIPDSEELRANDDLTIYVDFEMDDVYEPGDIFRKNLYGEYVFKYQSHERFILYQGNHDSYEYSWSNFYPNMRSNTRYRLSVSRDMNEMWTYFRMNDRNGTVEQGDQPAFYQGTHTDISQTDNDVKIGGTSDFFDGRIYEIKVFDDAKHSEGTSELMMGRDVRENLILHYKFDSENELTDYSGNGNTGTVHGASLITDTQSDDKGVENHRRADMNPQRYDGWEAKYEEFETPSYETDIQNESLGDFTLNIADSSNMDEKYISGDGIYTGESILELSHFNGNISDELSLERSSISEDVMTTHATLSHNFTKRPVSDSMEFDLQGQTLKVEVIKDLYFNSFINVEGDEKITIPLNFNPARTSEFFDFIVSYDENNIYIAFGQRTERIQIDRVFDSFSYGYPSSVRLNLTNNCLGTTHVGEFKTYQESYTDWEMKNHIEMEGRISPNPWNKDFSLAFDHHADSGKELRLEPIFEYAEKNGIRLDTSIYWDSGYDEASSLSENETFSDLLKNYHESDTIRVGYHSIGNFNADRNDTIQAFEDFKYQLGFYPELWSDHGNQPENFGREGMNESSEYYLKDIVTENVSYVWVNEYKAPYYNDRTSGITYNLLSDSLNYTQKFMDDYYIFEDATGYNYKWEHPDGYGSVEMSSALGRDYGRYPSMFTDSTSYGELSEQDGMTNLHTYMAAWWEGKLDGEIYSNYYPDIYTNEDLKPYRSDWKNYEQMDYDIARGMRNYFELMNSEYNPWWAFKEDQKKREDIWSSMELQIDEEANEIMVQNNHEKTLENASLSLSKDVLLQKGNTEIYSQSYENGFNPSSTPTLFKYFVDELEPGNTTFSYSEIDREDKPVETSDEDYASVRIIDNEKYFIPNTPESDSTVGRTISTGGENGFYTGGNYTVRDDGSLVRKVQEFGEFNSSELNYSLVEKLGSVKPRDGVAEFNITEYNDENWDNETQTIVKWEESTDYDTTIDYEIDTNNSGEKFRVQRYEGGEWNTISYPVSDASGTISFSTDEHSTNLLRIIGYEEDDGTDDSPDPPTGTVDTGDDGTTVSLSVVALFIMVLFGVMYFFTSGSNRRRGKKRK